MSSAPTHRLVQVGGNSYDLDVIGAAAQLVQAHSEAGWGHGLPPSPVLRRIVHWREVVALQRADLHAPAGGTPEATCSCGLVREPSMELTEGAGHLDLFTWNQAAVWVTRRADDFLASCLNGWREPAPDEAQARRIAAAHAVQSHA